MRITCTIQETRERLAEAKAAGKKIGFVPTMGYLHEGHARLVEVAGKHCDFVVVSIFVNPTQFAPGEDLSTYPRDAERDEALLKKVGCQLLFRPDEKEMYPTPSLTRIELPELASQLCGKSRPTHFQGVATVVAKLLHIVQPELAFFGMKDGQQLAVVKRMVEDLNFPVQIIGVPTVREEDGLAKSSRNVYLNEHQRQTAPQIYQALLKGKAAIEAGETDPNRVRQIIYSHLQDQPELRIDYVEVVRLSDLQPAAQIEGDIMLAVAVYLGKARLIDNLQLHVKNSTSGQRRQVLDKGLDIL
ncbi:pantoate--beta-alanine ligase [Alicyclobacillus sp. TC]|uniref:pantoate--beta-alanine ligase n=1 Tax=Alicyclobacillus sp. TC TaxID=2606450 RepID=UPI0019344A3F|nr:pantoate--beta-alanine ligase [Alicyclobacillus sp. TC]QRF24329.1 pantoate--beta-alanine ligase [Alicyclobacillus sp. TC]